MPGGRGIDKRIVGALIERGKQAGAAVIAYALPPRCPGCGAIVGGDHRFCTDCWRQLEFLGSPLCLRCGNAVEMTAEDVVACGPCMARPPACDRIRAAVGYGEIARRLALKLKYGGRPGVAETMARAMVRHAGEGPWLIAPVPLHRWRIWRRGYNQAALIARSVARLADQPLALDLLERSRATPVLRGLGPAARHKAVRGAFAVGPRWRSGIKGARVLLVDDVFTTGATAEACARALKRAGAGEVALLCWARVVRDDAAER